MYCSMNWVWILNGVNWIELGQKGVKFESPNWKQNGKPYQVNTAIRNQFNANQPKPQKKKGFLTRFFGAFLSSTENRKTDINQDVHAEYSEQADYSDAEDADLIEFEL